jgi:methylglyoxal synthase
MAAASLTPQQIHNIGAPDVMTTRIALIAHDHKKDAIVGLAGEYVETLRRCEIVATGTTGARIAEAHGLQVQRMLSGPHGGDLQIGSQLAEGHVDMVIFLRDPMTPQPHEPDINALVRACDVHNVPCATNISTARMILDVLTLRLADPV